VSLKLLADPQFPQLVVKKIKRAGHDAVHAGEIGASDLPPREILRLASFEDRIVLSRNPRLARLVESEPGPWPSVVLIKLKGGGSDAMSRMLVEVLALFDEDLVSGAVVIVNEGQTLLRKFLPPADSSNAK
jgi:predicted nuclease of predicted toxin-antitoxin system